jgi:pimeloyl-ACP methyl ester carboxylesterase
VEAAKSFLMEKNNAEQLNIEQLGVLGDGVGALIALNWAAMDWNARSLPAYKMGQDVKALILVSPVRSFRGVTAQAALSHPVIRQKLATMIMVGSNDGERYTDAKRIYNTLKRYHDEKDQDLFFIASDTSLQGVKLISARGLNNGTQIIKFVDWVLVRRAQRFPWQDRTSPLK